MADDLDDIRKQVQNRVTAEAATLPAPQEKPPITSKLIQECLNSNALGDATLYAVLFRDRFVFCKDMKEWFEWNGNYWQRDVMDHSHAAVGKVCEQYLNEYRSIGEEIIKLSTARAPDPAASESEDEDAEESPKESARVKKLKARQAALLKRVWQLREPKRRDACLKFAHQIEDSLAIVSESLDLHPMLFACANGVIDLTTGTLKPGRPGDYLTMASPIEFKGIDEPSPLWEKSLVEIFGAQIKAEYPCILAWMVRGCLLYQKYGLNPPKAVREATEKYRRGEDLLADFIDECCIREPGAKCKSSVLYRRFVDWWHENIGRKEESGTWFGKQLSQKFERSKSNGCVVYHGIDVVEIEGEPEA